MLDYGIGQIRRFDPSFDEGSFLETALNLFFRIQEGWMSGSLEGLGDALTDEMADVFGRELDVMKQKGHIRRLESINVSEVEMSEACHDYGMDHITVIFAGSLIDYTVDEVTGQLVGGDNMDPVRFKEYWNFCRNSGSHKWQVSAIYKLKPSSAQPCYPHQG